MTRYAYRAYDPQGVLQIGEVSAESERAAEARVAAWAYSLVELRLVEGTAPVAAASQSIEQRFQQWQRRVFRQPPPASDVAQVLKNLALMVRSGVPIAEAVGSMSASAADPNLSGALSQVRREILDGKPVSQAFANASLFPAVAAELMHAAEAGGGLDQALLNAARFVERNAMIRNKVGSALLYPTVLLAMSAATMVFLMTYVLPRFATTYASLRVELPMATQILLSIGESMRQSPWLYLGGLAVAIGLGIVAVRDAGARRLASGWLRRLPFVRQLFYQIEAARVLLTLSSLLEGGVPLVQALRYAGRTAESRALREGVEESAERVNAGQPLSSAWARPGLFPAAIVQVATAGEQSGRLAPLLQGAAEHLEESADHRLKALLTLVEPLLIAVTGLSVAFVALAVVSPIYQLVEQIR